jgi:hypothetical protein
MTFVSTLEGGNSPAKKICIWRVLVSLRRCDWTVGLMIDYWLTLRFVSVEAVEVLLVK